MLRLISKFIKSTLLLPVVVALVSLKLFELIAPPVGPKKEDAEDSNSTSGGERLRPDTDRLIVFEGDETVLWLNIAFIKLWRRWSREFEDDFLESIHPLVMKAQTNLLPRVCIGTLSLGNEPPRIITARTRRTASDTEIVIDAHAEWTSSDQEVTISPSLTSKHPILSATKLFIKARLRIVVELMKDRIGVERISVSVMGKPRLKVSITPLSSSVDLLGIAKVGEWFSTILHFVVQEMLLFPNAFKFELNEDNKESDNDAEEDDQFLSRRPTYGHLDLAYDMDLEARLSKTVQDHFEALRATEEEMLNYRNLLSKEMLESAERGCKGFLLIKLIEGVGLSKAKKLGDSMPVVDISVGTESWSTRDPAEISAADLFFNERMYFHVMDEKMDLLHAKVLAQRSGLTDIIHSNLIVGSAWISVEEIVAAKGKAFSWLDLADTTGDCEENVGSLRLQMEYRRFDEVQSDECVNDNQDEEETEGQQPIAGHWKLYVLEMTRWTGTRLIHDMRCEIECEGVQYSTKTSYGNRQPAWGEHFVIEMRDPLHDCLRFFVLDDDLLQEDVIVGRGALALTDMHNAPAQEVWLPLQGSQTHGCVSKVCKLRLWVSYESVDPQGAGGHNELILNPTDADMGQRAEVMKRRFLRRTQLAGDTKDPVLLQALGNLSTDFMMHLSQSTAPSLVRMGRDAVYEKVHGALHSKANASRGIAELMECSGIRENAPEMAERQQDQLPVVITFITGEPEGAGTDGSVWVSLSRENRSCTPIRIQRNTASFQKGKKDMFCITVPQAFTPPDRMRVGHWHSGLSGNWNLAKVKIEPLTLKVPEWRRHFIAEEWIVPSAAFTEGIELIASELIHGTCSTTTNS